VSALRRAAWVVLAVFVAWALWRMCYFWTLLFYVEEVMP
jgi:hypothetical protein